MQSASWSRISLRWLAALNVYAMAWMPNRYNYRFVLSHLVYCDNFPFFFKLFILELTFFFIYTVSSISSLPSPSSVKYLSYHSPLGNTYKLLPSMDFLLASSLWSPCSYSNLDLVLFSWPSVQLLLSWFGSLVFIFHDLLPHLVEHIL